MTTGHRPLNRTFSGSVQVPVAAETLFDYLDDHRRLSAHMTKRSWLMVGSRMTVSTDDRNGQGVGSHIFLDGRVLGLRLAVDEIVEEYHRPLRKTWATVGEPHLLVIGAYRMGFELEPVAGNSWLRVFIDYVLPTGPFTHWPGRMLGDAYAKWCVRMMLADAVREFRESR